MAVHLSLRVSNGGMLSATEQDVQQKTADDLENYVAPLSEMLISAGAVLLGAFPEAPFPGSGSAPGRPPPVQAMIAAYRDLIDALAPLVS